ncbi:putative pyrroloquinoline-quinone binding quinoprotein [Cellulosimicrobium cellulans J34]|nr:putative pyrroloquinoline-quinone binding quinoprotein [Cellulosimicrobium cellulans J34]SMF14754.1 PQQ-like domain-containing protein [Cellulosimicrobium cellulans J1]
MPLRRRDARDRLTFELVESTDADVDDEVGSPASEPRPAGAPGFTRPPTGTGASGPADLDARPGATPLASHDPADPAASPDAGPGVAEDAVGDGFDGGDGDAPAGARDETVPPRRGRRTAVVGATAAGVALVLGGMLAVDAWQGRGELDRLRTAPGAVEPLPDAPEERWTTDVALANSIGFLPSTVVTVEEGAAVGSSLDTGEELWRVDVGVGAACGSVFLWSPPAGEPDPTIVCVAPALDGADGQDADDLPTDLWTGRVQSTDWEVVVVDAAGEVLGRRSTTTEGGVPAPGPGGTVVRAERVGPVPEGDGTELEIDMTTGSVGEIPEGRAAVLRVEDALTGDVRWDAELPFVARSGQCVEWSEVDGAETVRASLEGLWTGAEPRLVRVDGCGVTGWFTPDGARLDDPDNPVDSVVALGDGSYYRDPASNEYGWGYGSPEPADPAAAPAVLGPDGSLRWEAPGPVLVPQSTDGRPAPLLVQDGLEVAAFDGTGAEVWRGTEPWTPESVLVAAGGTFVVSTGYGGAVLVGIDAATGRETWSLSRDDVDGLLGDSGSEASGWSVDSAYTDGSRAIAVISNWQDGSSTLVALDLADGRVVWTADWGEDARGSWVLPIQGRLLRLGEAAITRLG